MTTTYQLNANELTADFPRSVKAAFKNKVIEITVTDTEDDTAYLLSTEANRRQLQEASKALKSGEGITMSVEELQKRYGL